MRQEFLFRTAAADSGRELPGLGELAGGVGDVRRVDAGPGERFLASPRAGHPANGEPGEPEVALVGGEQRVGDGRSEAALRVVVFRDDEPAAGVVGGGPQGSYVDRLDRVAVDDAGGDA